MKKGEIITFDLIPYVDPLSAEIMAEQFARDRKVQGRLPKAERTLTRSTRRDLREENRVGDRGEIEVFNKINLPEQ